MGSLSSFNGLMVFQMVTGEIWGFDRRIRSTLLSCLWVGYYNSAMNEGIVYHVVLFINICQVVLGLLKYDGSAIIILVGVGFGVI